MVKNISEILVVFCCIFLFTSCSGGDTGSNGDTGRPVDSKNQKLIEHNNQAFEYLKGDSLKIRDGMFSFTGINELLVLSDQIKIILQFDNVAKTYLLKKDRQNTWSLKSLKFYQTQAENELAIPLPNSPVNSYFIATKTLHGKFDIYLQSRSSSGVDRGVPVQNFEDYVKAKIPYLKELFPDGYRQQLDQKGSFLEE